MSKERMTNAIHQLHQAVLAYDAPDGQLVDDFVIRRDPAALEAILRRHGPMIWNVCRRLLSKHEDAEDAFQATFLVFVRKAASIVPREMVANWLFGVARQTALKARAMVAKRRTRERQVIKMPESTLTEEKDVWTDLQPILDQELSRLPDKHRAVIILCDLEGKSRSEAARHLGWPEGTVAGRLSRARATLARRLAQRGIVLSGGALAVVLAGEGAAATLPTSVLAETIKSTNLIAVGSIAVGTVTTARVAELAEGVVKTMYLAKLKPLMATILLSAILFGGGLATLHLAGAREANRPNLDVAENEIAQPVVEKLAGKKDEEKAAFAVKEMKANLDAVSNFTCRYVTYHSKAPTLADALQDRNVKRTPSQYGLWVVRKPAERFVIVKEKEILDRRANVSLCPIDLAGFFEDPKIGDKVWKNYLWTGQVGLRVDYDGNRKQCSLTRGFSAGVHPRSPGTPLEGEYFNYMDLDFPFHSGKSPGLKKDYNVSMVGVGDDGMWQIHSGYTGERPFMKVELDPKRGFLPTRISALVDTTKWSGERVRLYKDWHATHFEKVGNKNWFTTRSINISPPDTFRVISSNDSRLIAKDVYFQELKAEMFDWKTKVTDDDLAIAIPEDYRVQGFADRQLLMKNKLERKVSPASFPELLKDLEAFENYLLERDRKRQD